jgi:Flp pilus assembly protein TadG
MKTSGFKVLWQQARSRAHRKTAAWRHDDSGATAIEFAMVSFPFLALLFGIMAVGLFFFTTFSTENAVEQAARPIRTGEAQAAGMTKDQFKASVCAKMPIYVDCTAKLRVNVQSFNVGQAIVAPDCVDAGGALVAPAGTPFAVGAANQIMLVSACLEWTLAGKIPFLQIGKMSNGAALIQASTTFKIEPY